MSDQEMNHYIRLEDLERVKAMLGEENYDLNYYIHTEDLERVKAMLGEENYDLIVQDGEIVGIETTLCRFWLTRSPGDDGVSERGAAGG